MSQTPSPQQQAALDRFRQSETPSQRQQEAINRVTVSPSRSSGGGGGVSRPSPDLRGVTVTTGGRTVPASLASPTQPSVAPQSQSAVTPTVGFARSTPDLRGVTVTTDGRTVPASLSPALQTQPSASQPSSFAQEFRTGFSQPVTTIREGIRGGVGFQRLIQAPEDRTTVSPGAALGVLGNVGFGAGTRAGLGFIARAAPARLTASFNSLSQSARNRLAFGSAAAGTAAFAVPAGFEIAGTPRVDRPSRAADIGGQFLLSGAGFGLAGGSVRSQPASLTQPRFTPLPDNIDNVIFSRRTRVVSGSPAFTSEITPSGSRNIFIGSPQTTGVIVGFGDRGATRAVQTTLTFGAGGDARAAVTRPFPRVTSDSSSLIVNPTRPDPINISPQAFRRLRTQPQQSVFGSRNIDPIDERLAFRSGDRSLRDFSFDSSPVDDVIASRAAGRGLFSDRGGQLLLTTQRSSPPISSLRTQPRTRPSSVVDDLAPISRRSVRSRQPLLFARIPSISSNNLFSIGQVSSARSGTDFIPSLRQTPIQSTSSATRQITSPSSGLISAQLFSPITPTAPTPRVPTPRTPTPRTPRTIIPSIPSFNIPNFGLNGRGTASVRSTPRTQRLDPSLVAAIGGIRGTAPRGNVFTGIEVRPIIR